MCKGASIADKLIAIHRAPGHVVWFFLNVTLNKLTRQLQTNSSRRGVQWGGEAVAASVSRVLVVGRATLVAFITIFVLSIVVAQRTNF